MARVANNTGVYDVFKTKCKHCGREITYGRRDIRPHRRWPDGFIYCPACKQPMGHDEGNMFQTGEEVLEKRAQEIQRRAEARNKGRVNINALPAKAKTYRILKIVLLATGIPTLVAGALCVLIGAANVIPWYATLICGLLVFPLGLGCTIAGGVFAKKYNECVLMLNNQESKKEQ